MKIKEICKMAVLGCRRNPQAQEVEDCIKCEFKNGMCDVYRVAEKIYEQNKDKLMLTREELHEIEENAYQVGITMGKKFGSKETAIEIIEHIKLNGTLGCGGYVIHDSTIEQMCKKYGVDLGE